MRTPIIAIPIAALVAGCTTPAEQAAQAERDVDQMIRIYGHACERLGFNANTDPWRNCIIGLGQRDAASLNAAPYYGPPYWRFP